mgnify:CR=1 FL=1
MRKVTGATVGILGLLYVFAVLAISIGSLGLTLYGIVLAFSASVVLGILVLFVQPAPLIIGAVMFFFDKDIAQMIVNFLTH